MGKKNQDPGSGMNNPGHISEGLKTNFWVKHTGSGILEFNIPEGSSP
jgi:hypothetical protein